MKIKDFVSDKHKKNQGSGWHCGECAWLEYNSFKYTLYVGYKLQQNNQIVFLHDTIKPHCHGINHLTQLSSLLLQFTFYCCVPQVYKIYMYVMLVIPYCMGVVNCTDSVNTAHNEENVANLM